MINLSKRVLPSAIKVDGVFYPIKTDFHDVLLFFERIEAGATSYTAFDFMYLEEKPADRKAGFEAMLSFFNAQNTLPRTMGATGGARLLDYKEDADLIYSAFLEQYHINLLTAFLHWYEFKALLAGLHDTKLNEVINYRAYDETDKRKSEQIRRELKAAWSLESKLTAAEKEALEKFDKDFA